MSETGPASTSRTPRAGADAPPRPDPQAPERSAIKDAASHLRFWTVVVLGLALDLWSKSWAFTTLRQGGRRVLIPHVLEFQTTMNPGALFGIGAGHTEVFLIASVLALALVLWMFAQSSTRRWLLHVALGAILAGALGNMYDRMTVEVAPYTHQTAAGGVARYYLRSESADGQHIVLREYPPDAQSRTISVPKRAEELIGPSAGHVRDFIKIPTRWFGQREVWPWVFNVADMLLVGGVIVLALRLLRESRAEAAEVKSPAAGLTTAGTDARDAPRGTPGRPSDSVSAGARTGGSDDS